MLWNIIFSFHFLRCNLHSVLNRYHVAKHIIMRNTSNNCHYEPINFILSARLLLLGEKFTGESLSWHFIMKLIPVVLLWNSIFLGAWQGEKSMKSWNLLVGLVGLQKKVIKTTAQRSMRARNTVTDEVGDKNEKYVFSRSYGKFNKRIWIWPGMRRPHRDILPNTSTNLQNRMTRMDGQNENVSSYKQIGHGRSRKIQQFYIS